MLPLGLGSSQGGATGVAVLKRAYNTHPQPPLNVLWGCFPGDLYGHQSRFSPAQCASHAEYNFFLSTPRWSRTLLLPFFKPNSMQRDIDISFPPT